MRRQRCKLIVLDAELDEMIVEDTTKRMDQFGKYRKMSELSALGEFDGKIIARRGKRE